MSFIVRYLRTASEVDTPVSFCAVKDPWSACAGSAANQYHFNLAAIWRPVHLSASATPTCV